MGSQYSRDDLFLLSLLHHRAPSLLRAAAGHRLLNTFAFTIAQLAFRKSLLLQTIPSNFSVVSHQNSVPNEVFKMCFDNVLLRPISHCHLQSKLSCILHVLTCTLTSFHAVIPG